jgi:hypothetical protein
MAELSITAIRIIYLPSGILPPVKLCGDNVAVGSPVRFGTGANAHKMYMTGCDTAANSLFVGIAVMDGDTGQWITYAPPGSILQVTGDSPALGTPYFAMAGKSHPYADLSGGEYITQTLLGRSSTTVVVADGYSGYAK